MAGFESSWRWGFPDLRSRRIRASVDRRLRGWDEQRNEQVQHNTNEEQPQQKSQDMNRMKWKGVE